MSLFFVSFFLSSKELIDTTLSSRYLGVFGVLLIGFIALAKRVKAYLQTEIRWLDVLLLAFCLWQVLSIFWATNSAEAFASSFRSVALFLAYLFLRVLVVSDERWKRYLPLTVSLASSVYLLVLWIELFSVTSDIGLNAQSIYLLRYPTETKNLTSIILLISMAFHLQDLLQNQGWKRWFSIVNMVLMLGTLFLFSTRGISLSILAIGGAIL
ncbi:MAG: hypothetical protein ACPG5W_00455, partial [Flavobacteriales bacterium]